MKNISSKLMSITLLVLIVSSNNCFADKKNAVSNAQSEASNTQSAKSDKTSKAKSKSSTKSDESHVDVTVKNNTDFPVKIRGSHLGKEHDTKSGAMKKRRVSEIYTQKTSSDATNNDTTAKDTTGKKAKNKDAKTKGATTIAAHGHAVYTFNTNKEYEYIAVQIKDKKEVNLETRHGNDFTSKHTWTIAKAGAHDAKHKDAKNDKAKATGKKAKAKSNTHAAAKSTPASTSGISNVKVTKVATPASNADSDNANSFSSANSLSGSGM